MLARSPHHARRVRARTRKTRCQAGAGKAELAVPEGTESQLDEKLLAWRSGQTAHRKTNCSERTNRIDTVIPTKPPVRITTPCQNRARIARVRFAAPHIGRTLASCARSGYKFKSRRAAPAGSLSRGSTVSLSEWPNEAQAAAALGISAKTIIRYASAGKIETRKRQRPGKKPENVYNPQDLERRGARHASRARSPARFTRAEE